MWTWTTGLQLLLPLLLVHRGQSYPGGSPDMACESMLPTGHGSGPQTSDPPYNIYVSKKSYKPGETLQVIVQPNGEEYFRGIILQARMTGCNVNETRIVGTFTNTDRDLETKHCFGDIHSTVSHNSPRKKRLKTFYWTAPVISSGHVVMRATFVKELQEYWTHVQSEVVADLHSTVVSKCTHTPPPPTPGSTLLPTPAEVINPITGGTMEPSPGETNQPTVRQKTHSRPDTTTPTLAVEENLPTWLGPAFNRRDGPPSPAEDVSRDHGGPSWLIPAYQRAASSSSSPSSSVSVWVHGGAAVVVLCRIVGWVWERL